MLYDKKKFIIYKCIKHKRTHVCMRAREYTHVCMRARALRKFVFGNKENISYVEINA